MRTADCTLMGDNGSMKPALARILKGMTVIVAGALSGCSSGPDFVRPGASRDLKYTAASMPAETESAATRLGEAQRFRMGEPVDAHWWRHLGSPRLDKLIERAFAASPSLAAAEAGVRQAKELHAAQARTVAYPRVTVGGSALRQRMNPNMLGLPSGAREFSLYSATLDVQYRFDPSGGNRRALEALAARVDYRHYEWQGVRLKLAARLTLAAIRRANIADRIEATLSITASQEEQLAVIRARKLAGLGIEDEELAFRVQMEQTRTSLVQLQRHLDQSEHLLAVLAGQPPGSSEMPAFTLDEFVLPPDLPVLLPTELARRRPDIQAAESLLHAANAEHGVAVARLYPQMNLSASGGSQSLSMDSLFGGGSAVWSVIAQLTQPLLNVGLAAEKRASLAALDAASANYRFVVLEALREVADALRVIHHDARILAAQAAADSAERDVLESTDRRYSLGLTSYFELLIAKERSQQTRILLLDAQAQRLADSVVLFQAMGGGLSGADET